ncbi:MAG: hypothetical protein ACOX8M_09915 [Marvinbryantia sp.]|jgi:hypothetical protein
MENTSDYFMPRPLLFCMKSEKSVCYSVPDNSKEENIRVRVTPEQKQRLVEYAERHYQSMSGVVCQALDLLYAREEQQNNKE